MVSRKRKQVKDRISELHDSLLLHILSFLPTKCVVSTSILSKRWRNVWTSIPILDFRQWRSHKVKESNMQTKNFKRFMDRMLAAPHDCMPNVQEFYLDFDKNLTISKVNAWISTLVKRKVEKLHLYIEYRVRSLVLSPCLFTCESLTMLELHLKMYSDLKLPESTSFPRLKILRLSYIHFADEKRTQLFFSNCPILEELILNDCSCDMKHAIISAPSLKYLAFTYYGPWPHFLTDSVLKINAPNLVSLKYMEHVAMDYILCNFLSLVDANISLRVVINGSPSREEYQSMGYAANKLVQKLSNVKVLKMSCETFMLLSFADDLITYSPTFHNLIHLEVTSSSLRSIIRVFFDFLQVTPNLESLVFDEDPYHDLGGDDSWTINAVPQCLLLHLKTVEFHRYHGFTHSKQLIWVKLFLKNASVLQKMTITSEFSKIKEEFMEEIRMYPRASTNCSLSFEFGKHLTCG